jgi:serine/threonine protein kinase
MQVVKEKSGDNRLMDLIGRVMRYNPKDRYTPYQALMHPYFD